MTLARDFRGTDRFVIVRRIGAGGMGVVYEALDGERGARVALKTLRRIDAQALYRLKNEFRSLADIEHPNLVGLGELVEAEGEWFFTVEFVEGSDFLAWVRPGVEGAAEDGSTGMATTQVNDAPPLSARRVAPPAASDGPAPGLPPRFDEPRLRAALGQLARGVAALHERGMVHRDIKPSNIRVTPEGRVVLLDFGLVTETARGDSTEAHAVGTAAYMAPEQAASRPVGPAADWYSVGVLLYEALTGALPFSGPTLQILMDKQAWEPPPPRARVPAVPADLDALCVEDLHYDPAARPPARAILARLGADTGAAESAHRTTSDFTQTTPFVGRDAELDALERAFADTRGGQAVTVVIEGESGVGKSAVVAEFTGRVAASGVGAVVLHGRCYERESVPYKAVDGVIDALSQALRRMDRAEAAVLLPRHAGLLARVFPVLARVEVIAEAPRPTHEAGDPYEQRHRLYAGLRELFARLAERRPLVMAIDDLQWADRDSLLLLGEILRPPEAPPLLLLLTARPGSPVAPERESFPIAGEVRHIALEPLPAASASQLADLLLARAGIDGDAGAIAGEAQGHPLFIDALVRYAALQGSGSRPVRVGEAIAARVNALPALARQVLELVCCTEAPLSQERIAAAAEMEPDELLRQVGRLRVANLVKTGGARLGNLVEPYHDRVREAMLAEISPEVRARHHGRLAAALGSAGGDPALLLRHLEAAGQIDRAADIAVTAAEAAARALAFDRAAELYQAALRLGQWSATTARELTQRLAEALANAGRGPEAAPAFATAADGADPATRLECFRQAAEQWLISGHIERGLEALQRLLAEIGTGLPATPRRALASLLWHRARLRLRGLGFEPRQESQISREDLIHVDIYKTVSTGLSMVDTIRGADFQARGLLRALRVGEPTRAGRAIALEAAYLGTQGGRSLVRARTLTRTTNELADASADPYLRAWAIAAEGMISYFEGGFAVASERGGEAETQFRVTPGTTWDRNTVRLFRVFALRQRGAVADLAALVEESQRDATRRGDRYLETSILYQGTFPRLARDDLAGARRDLALASWMPPEGVFHLQHWWELEARGEIALYAGTVAAGLAELAPRFDGLRRSLLLRIQIVRSISRWLHGRLLAAAAAAAGDDDRGAALRPIARIAGQLDGEGIGFAGVFAALLHAGRAALTGDRAATLAALDRAIAGAGDEMLLHAATARRGKGLVLGGSEGAALIADAEAWMHREGIRNPGCMTRVYVPGLDALLRSPPGA